MSPIRQVQALAELENDEQRLKFLQLFYQCRRENIPYLTSYDAIIPLIQKQPQEVIDKMAPMLWKLAFKIVHTPPELCEALLRAHDKWETP